MNQDVDLKRPAADAPKPLAADINIPAADSASPKALPASTLPDKQETKPPAGSDMGDKARSFISGAALPFRWMFGILLHKYVIMFLAILFSLFVLLPVALTLGFYTLSHAPTYMKNHLLGQGYEYGNPFSVSYSTWLPSWGGSKNDTVPKMHVVEEVQEPPPLKFRRPIPQAETDILPDVIMRYKERLAASSHERKEELLANLAKSKARALGQREFNQYFINDMETRAILQYLRLQALVASIDLIL